VQEYPGGYGLGLAIVRRLANQLGHSIEVATKPGRGSCFAVKVPLADHGASLARGDESAGTGRPLEGLRVLLLGTDPVTTDTVRLLVEDWGGAVETTPSADLAAKQLGETGMPPQAVLADLRFGGAAGGIVTLRQLLARSEHLVRGIILVEENTPVREREIALAGYRMITKPIAPEALFHALR
jgi:CheY-like chemotaxis protein